MSDAAADNTIAREDLETLIREHKELAHENRRLRQMLAVVAEAGLGKVSLCELYRADYNHVGVLVCRADRDEEAFCREMFAAIEKLAEVVGLELTGVIERKGVTKEEGDGPA